MDVNSDRIPPPEPITLLQDPLRNIRYFRQQWKCFSVAAGLDQMPIEKRVAMFFLYLGREAYAFISDNLDLTEDEANDCDGILNALESWYTPKVNLINERFVFNQAVQEDDETVNCFVLKLRKLAENCGFEERTEEMIRDRFIVGLKSKSIQKMLLSHRDLCLRKAIRLCQVKEENDTDVRSPSRQRDGDTRGASEAYSSSPESSLEDDDSRIKVEEIMDEDDVMIVSGPKEQTPAVLDVTSSPEQPEQATKRARIEPTKSNSDRDDTESQLGDVEELIASQAEVTVGSFLILKEDWHKVDNPTIWKVDKTWLLQKFVPVEINGTMMYKSTAVYSSMNSRNKYYRASVIVRNNQSNRKESLVQLQKSLLLSENMPENSKNTRKQAS